MMAHNPNNLRWVAEEIEGANIAGLGFSMSLYWKRWEDDGLGHPCGTVACIAGHAFAVAVDARMDGDADVWTEYTDRTDDSPSPTRIATEFLGLYADAATALFHPSVDAAWRCTRAQAATVLRRLSSIPTTVPITDDMVTGIWEEVMEAANV